MILVTSNPSFKVTDSQYSLKVNISQTMHPIHSMFGSRLGFSGSVDRMVLEWHLGLQAEINKLC